MQKYEIPENIPNDEKHDTYEFEASEFENDSLITCREDITKKTVPTIERIVRNSEEYKNYIKYLKDELDMTKCSMLPGLDINDVKVSLEFHHFPLNLYEVSEAVLLSKVDNLSDTDKGVSLFDVSEEVVKEHYLNEVGLIPLSKTAHEMAHNRSLIIPMNKVYGNYKKFLKKYSSSISQEIKDRVSDAEAFNNTKDAEEFNKQKLQKRIINYDVHYSNRDDNDDSEKEEENE